MDAWKFLVTSYYSFLFGDENGHIFRSGLPLDMGVGPPIKGKGPFSGALAVCFGAFKRHGTSANFSRLLTAPRFSSCHRHCEAHP